MISSDIANRVAALIEEEGKESRPYRKFADALLRLVSDPQEPENDVEFVEMAAEGRPIKVIIANVAREAGLSPQRFTGPKSDFPKMSAFVKSLRSSHGVSEKTTEKLGRQASDIRQLEQMLTATRSKLAEALILKEEAVRELEVAQEQIKRLRAQIMPDRPKT